MWECERRFAFSTNEEICVHSAIHLNNRDYSVLVEYCIRLYPFNIDMVSVIKIISIFEEVSCVARNLYLKTQRRSNVVFTLTKYLPDFQYQCYT